MSGHSIGFGRFFDFLQKLAFPVAIAALSLNASAETWRIGLIGDTPYSDRERAELPKMMAAMVDRGVELIAHIGDIKHGADRCDDAVFDDRYRLFNSSPVPFVYVPGDNEWTDCTRTSNGGYEQLERLNQLRHLFWSTPRSLGQNAIPLERQVATYPEHARFRIGPVLFVTLNIPGGNNNHGPDEAPSREYMARNPVVLDWLRDSFALARRDKLQGIVLLFQANPGFSVMGQAFPAKGYAEFLSVLRHETEAYPGQVLAVHGDTHINRIDHPLRGSHGRSLRNFTRLETFGYPLMGWNCLIIDSASPALYRFETYPWNR